jgi:integration host factor subunit beta
MTRSDLIAELAAGNPYLRQSDAELIVLAVFDHIVNALAHGQRVELRGFGSFTMRQRKARTGHNPRTGEAVSVTAKAVPHFKAGRELLRRLNGNHRSAVPQRRHEPG